MFFQSRALYVDHGSAGERRGGNNTHLIDEGEVVMLELVTLRGEMLVASCYLGVSCDDVAAKKQISHQPSAKRDGGRQRRFVQARYVMH